MNTGFKQFKLNPQIVKALELMKLTNPTPVQEKVIPLVMEHKDIIVKSQTGSGKTAAFAIPLCSMVQWEENRPQALVLTPTRELAIQVKEEITNIGRLKRIRVPALYGKQSFKHQERDLRQKAHIAVGTPGRVLDHLERGTFETSYIQYLVIDEADEMLNMGFIDQVAEIIERLPEDRVTLLFSATMPKRVVELAKEYMNDPEEVVIKSQGMINQKIDHSFINVEGEDKMDVLLDVLTVENPDTAIIFCNTRIEVEDVTIDLIDEGLSCRGLHGGMEQEDRQAVMEQFKRGKFRYLVSTDVAARGIDVDDISLVINYDLPKEEESYIHRVGRTGRAGKTGKCITFSNNWGVDFIQGVEEQIKATIEEVSRPRPEAVEAMKEQFMKKMETELEVKEDKGLVLTEGITKLHVNAGKKDKIRPVDIVGTLCNIDGMTADDIGIITILDYITYVEVLHNKANIVLKALQKKPLKGMVRKVSIAKN